MWIRINLTNDCVKPCSVSMYTSNCNDVWSCDHQANWVPRRENNNPKKIDQIHQEAKQEEAEKMRELSAKDDGSEKEDNWLDQWLGVYDKDKKLPSSQPPKLDSNKFRNLGNVCCYGTLLCYMHVLSKIVILCCIHSNLVYSSV